MQISGGVSTTLCHWMSWCTLADVPHAYNSASLCSGVVVNALVGFLYLAHVAGNIKQVVLVLPFMQYVVHRNWLKVVPVTQMVHSTSHALHISADIGLPWTWYAIKAIRFPMWMPQYVQLLHHFRNCWPTLRYTLHSVCHTTVHRMLKQSLYICLWRLLKEIRYKSGITCAPSLKSFLWLFCQFSWSVVVALSPSIQGALFLRNRVPRYNICCQMPIPYTSLRCTRYHTRTLGRLKV